mmetsp:Transcript_4722/g.6485  ORF Transcript_4722/g.6485 Transcript_4722/m.6485 type:complete len:229 (+) Transcript_4722:104-790(+)
MPILTFVARVMDGLLLVASMDTSSMDSSRSNETMDLYKNQAKQILKKLNPRSVAKCSIDSGQFIFHYMIEAGICYLTLTDKGYPKRLAFLYLEEIHDAFMEELQRDHGDDWRNKVDTVSRPYAFIKFDKFIQRKRKDYADPSSRSSMAKLNDDLADIHNVMKKNIREVLDRGERIDHVATISSKLVDDSRKFKWGTKKLTLMALYQKYGPIAAIVLLGLVIIYIKFFW